MKFKFTFLISILLIACNSSEKKIDFSYEKAQTYQADYLHQCMSKLTDVIVHDIFSPPVASRNYVYPALVFYEILQQENPNYRSLKGQIKDFDGIPQANDTLINLPLASVKAFIEIGKKLIYSENQMNEFEKEILLKFKESKMSDSIVNLSLNYGKEVAEMFWKWAKQDNYEKVKAMPRHPFSTKTGKWQPTPPDYMEAIEPHWNKMRTFIIDSATQFIPIEPPAFNLTKNSQFQKDLLEVYKIGKNLSEEQKQIASFWDCNPFVVQHQGHLMLGSKKITPGGHWIGITEIACKKENLGLLKTAETYAFVSIALADAFISCWDEKYRSNLIRPETVINEHLDPNWNPLLQTPPFPEYTSGHSVISRAAAISLTHLLGDNFSYVDSVEVKYGLPSRKFNSFIEASEEAAISRLYGGIHYMPAIENGVSQGEKVGKYIVEHLVLGEK